MNKINYKPLNKIIIIEKGRATPVPSYNSNKPKPTPKPQPKK